MTKEMTISYQNRQSRGHGGTGIGSPSKDLKTAPKLTITNHILKRYGFSIGDKVSVEYLPNEIIIKKLT